VSAGCFLAVDVGGTKLAVGLTDAEGVLLRSRQVPTEPKADGLGEQLWLTLYHLIEDVLDGVSPLGIGVGCGGPMTWPAGVVSPLNLHAWHEFVLRDRLRALFSGVPVRLANDAIAMTIGEHWRGAARSFDNVLGVVVSTGVGGGLILDGRARYGDTGNAGHFGHIVVEPDGPACGCGGRGCVEAIARGPAVVAWAVAHGWEPQRGASADGRALLADANSGNKIAIAAFDRAGEAVGVAIASATHLLDLDLVVIGGGLSNAGELLLAPARTAFARHARMSFASRCRITRAELGGDAGLVGAAALVANGDHYWPTGAD
jgi:glucokinase